MRALTDIYPDLGTGIGLRRPYWSEVLERPEALGFVEVITENYLEVSEAKLRSLDAVRGRLPVLFHGVSMSVGSADPLDGAYLDRVRALVERFEPPWVSDHLCWTGVQTENSHELLPLPLTEESLDHVSRKVEDAQRRLGVPLLLENPSTYLSFEVSTLDEGTFLRKLVERTGCGLLVDVNNAFVNARNHGTSAEDFLDGLPAAAVAQVHLAGFSDCGTHYFDTHDAPIAPGVWRLYARLVERVGPVSTLIERDDDFPPFEELLEEVRRAHRVRELRRVA